MCTYAYGWEEGGVDKERKREIFYFARLNHVRSLSNVYFLIACMNKNI